jgi:hypothetical protein
MEIRFPFLVTRFPFAVFSPPFPLVSRETKNGERKTGFILLAFRAGAPLRFPV